MKPVKLVIVDCYGTMVHPPDIDAAIIKNLRQYCPVDIISGTFHRIRTELTPELKRPFISQRRRFDIIIDQLLSELHLPGSLRPSVCADVMDSFGTAPAYDDVTETLLRLSSLVRLTVVTNGDEQPVRSALKQFPAVFEDIVTSEAARCYKPDRGIFEYTLTRSRLDASSVVMIGDDPDRDCAPARKLGMHAIHIDRNIQSAADYRASFPTLASTLTCIIKLL